MTKNFFSGFILNMNIDSVNFGAKPINSIKIKKYDKNKGDFVDIPAKFVRLDADNRSDIKVLDKIAKNWKNADYIKKIATASHWMKTLPINIYALTTQQDGFDKLKSSRILGFAEMRKDDNFPKYDWLYHLQVKPEAINTEIGAKKGYQHIGKSIITSLKKIYHNISLFSADSPYLESFYKKNGFIEDYMNTRHYFWSSNVFKRWAIKFANFRFKYGL